MTSVRIGCGAGYAGDRIEPAVEIATKGDLDYLVFECLAERTIALAQNAKIADPSSGYNPLLVDRMTAVLPACVERGTAILTNMGAANPLAAAQIVLRTAHDLGLRGLSVAAVTGDDVLGVVRKGGYSILETGEPVEHVASSLVSANAYLGAEILAEALAGGADVVVAGRVADPSLFVAALMHTFEWRVDDWTAIGRATLVGHLLECAGQVTGGYFADPGYSDVAGLSRLGFPIAEVAENGSAVITKVTGSGGQVTTATCKEQLLYEIHDPAAYVTPDVVADFSGVRVAEVGTDRVRVDGADGTRRPDTLKVSLGYTDGFIGEGQMSYAGPGAVDRARLALSIVADRLRQIGVAYEQSRYEMIGVDTLHGARLSGIGRSEPYEVRVRVAVRTRTRKDAARVANEIEALYTNGPSGGGGASGSVREVLAVASTLVPRELVSASVQYFS